MHCDEGFAKDNYAVDVSWKMDGIVGMHDYPPMKVPVTLTCLAAILDICVVWHCFVSLYMFIAT